MLSALTQVLEITDDRRLLHCGRGLLRLWPASRSLVHRRITIIAWCRSCIAGAPEFAEQVREDRQQVACRKPDRQAQRVAEPVGVKACNPCPYDVRPHTGLAEQLVQMGELWIFTGECGRDQRCKSLVQTLPDKSFLRLGDCSRAGYLSHADDPLQVRRIHWQLSQVGAVQTIWRQMSCCETQGSKRRPQPIVFISSGRKAGPPAAGERAIAAPTAMPRR